MSRASSSFEALGDKAGVASSLHQLGMVQQSARQLRRGACACMSRASSCRSVGRQGRRGPQPASTGHGAAGARQLRRGACACMSRASSSWKRWATRRRGPQPASTGHGAAGSRQLRRGACACMSRASSSCRSVGRQGGRGQQPGTNGQAGAGAGPAARGHALLSPGPGPVPGAALAVR